MSGFLSVEVELGETDRSVGGLLRGLEDGRGLLAFFGQKLLKHERRMFATAGGGTWPALDQETVEKKNSSRTLVDDGGLLADLTGRYRITGESVEVSSSEIGGVMAKAGRHGPRRDPAPAPPSAEVRSWAEELLNGLTSGGGIR